LGLHSLRSKELNQFFEQAEFALKFRALVGDCLDLSFALQPAGSRFQL
jgi:hypothetical protein